MRSTIYSCLFLMMFLLLPSCAALASQTEQAIEPTRTSMKGWELYSWQEAGKWYFALLVGTNRTKTVEEVTAPDVRLEDVEALRAELQTLAPGEILIWSTHGLPGLALPPKAIQDEVIEYCAELGLQLELVP